MIRFDITLTRGAHGHASANAYGTLRFNFVRSDDFHEVHVHIGWGLNRMQLALSICNVQCDVAHA